MAELTTLSYVELRRCTRPAATSFAISYLLCSQMFSSLSLFWVKLEQSITSSSFCLGLLLQKNIWSSNYIILSLLTSFLWKQIFKITPTNHFTSSQISERKESQLLIHLMVSIVGGNSTPTIYF